MQHNATGLTAMLRGMAWDLGLPVVTYYGLHAAGASDSAALLAGTVAAGARLAWVAIRSRTLSPFSMVMGAVFGVGLLFTLLTGDPRFLLIKHSVMSAVIGALFLVTAFRGRPLTLAAQQTFLPARAAELAEAFATSPQVRRGHRTACLVWGGGLLAEAIVRAALVYTLPIDVMVGVSTALTIVTFTTLIAWNARYIATKTKQATTFTTPAATSTTVPTPISPATPTSASASAQATVSTSAPTAASATARTAIPTAV